MSSTTISKDLVVLNALRDTFDLHDIGNRRFMYCPSTGSLILGFESCGIDISKSHAVEHMLANVEEPFDSFIRGWVGTNKKEYKDGVIHFAPPVLSTSSMFEPAFCALELFKANGATERTVIRGFGARWEQGLKEILP